MDGACTWWLEHARDGWNVHVMDGVCSWWLECARDGERMWWTERTCDGQIMHQAPTTAAPPALGPSCSPAGEAWSRVLAAGWWKPAVVPPMGLRRWHLRPMSNQGRGWPGLLGLMLYLKEGMGGFWFPSNFISALTLLQAVMCIPAGAGPPASQLLEWSLLFVCA